MCAKHFFTESLITCTENFTCVSFLFTVKRKAKGALQAGDMAIVAFYLIMLIIGYCGNLTPVDAVHSQTRTMLAKGILY